MLVQESLLTHPQTMPGSWCTQRVGKTTTERAGVVLLWKRAREAAVVLPTRCVSTRRRGSTLTTFFLRSQESLEVDWMLLQRSKKIPSSGYPSPTSKERGKKCRFSIPHSPGLERGEDAASSDLQQRQREVILGNDSYNTARGTFTKMVPGQCIPWVNSHGFSMSLELLKTQLLQAGGLMIV